MNPNECFFFQPTDYTSSATVCKWCGKEKYQHKSEQKQLIIDIMNDDAKDGLYKQQTAVDWFFEKLEKNGDVWENASIRAIQISIDVTEYLDLKRQAKERFRQQIENAWYAGDEDGAIHEFEQYYNEEYGKL